MYNSGDEMKKAVYVAQDKRVQIHDGETWRNEPPSKT